VAAGPAPFRFGGLAWILLVMALPASAEAQPSGRLDVPGALFEYVAEGSGPPLVAFTGSENIGQQLYSDRLRQHVTIIHADPAPLTGERLRSLTMADVVDDIERVRRALGVDRIGVMGHSMFAPVPLEYALAYPEHARWSVVTGGVPYTTAEIFRAADEYWATAASEERKAIREANRKALAERNPSGRSPSDLFWDGYEAEVPYRFFDPRYDLGSFRRGLRTSTNMEFVNHFWGVVLKDYDRTSAYRAIRTPVLVISGRYDFGAPYFLWDEVGPLIEDYTFHLFERAGHNPMIETPEEFDRVLTEWMASRDVLAVFEQIEQAFLAGDLDLLMQAVHEEAVLMPPGSEPLVGRDAVAGYYGGLFETYAVAIRAEAKQVELDGDLAIVRAELQGALEPRGGGAPVGLRNKFLNVYRRDAEGGWKLYMDIWNPMPAG
jgi:proline iminopeptidase